MKKYSLFTLLVMLLMMTGCLEIQEPKTASIQQYCPKTKLGREFCVDMIKQKLITTKDMKYSGKTVASFADKLTESPTLMAQYREYLKKHKSDPDKEKNREKYRQPELIQGFEATTVQQDIDNLDDDLERALKMDF